MPTYYIPTHNTKITAKDEATARHLAMTKRWGAPAPLRLPQPGTKDRYTWIPDSGNTYSGHELTLIEE